MFDIEIKEKCGWIIGDGGPNGMLAPPLKLFGGRGGGGGGGGGCSYA